MGTLKHTETGARVDLLARTLVGRGPHCDLVLTEPSVSGDHAAIVWRGEGWEIRDLGSRNGTVVTGEVLKPGLSHELEAGAVITFGRASPWRLAEVGPPYAHAVALNGAGVVIAEGGMIPLPEPEAPEVLIVQRPGGDWVLERGESVEVVAHGSELSAGGHTWRLHLPSAPVSTLQRAPDIRTLAAATIHLEVGARGRIHWTVAVVGERLDLGRRSFNALLLALARARLEDAAAGDSLAAQGWRYREDIAEALGVEVNTLKVFAYRARRALAGAGVEGAGGLIERRRDTGQIRIGAERLETSAP